MDVLLPPHLEESDGDVSSSRPTIRHLRQVPPDHVFDGSRLNIAEEIRRVCGDLQGDRDIVVVATVLSVLCRTSFRNMLSSIRDGLDPDELVRMAMRRREAIIVLRGSLWNETVGHAGRVRAMMRHVFKRNELNITEL